MAEEINDPMEYIWEKIPKTKEGLVHYLPGDIPYLYFNGFVDAVQFSFEEWEGAFNDVKQEDGTYLVSRDKFMSLRRFRYVGPLYRPFDPQRLPEGEWTDEDLQKLYDLSIRPSSGITEEVYWNSIKALKGQGLVANNGRLILNKAVKTQLAYLIERFPSPRRRLEKEVHRIRQEREAEYRSAVEKRDASIFMAGKLASEDKQERFQALQSAGHSTAAAVKKILPDKPGIDIKKLKKPPRKISG